ncbi:MAG: GNAT family N-acetyltransferase [Solirubrobacteraceae bacterium]
MLSSELITDPRSLDSLESEWDALAVACRLPLMTPAWVMSWWRHVAPTNAKLRSIAVRDGDELIGLVPFYVTAGRWQRVDYRLPGIELAARLSPLAARGREWDVAASTAHLLAGCRPRPDAIALEGAPVASQWPAALRNRWPGLTRPVVRQYLVQGAPTISLREPSYEEWLAGKSANFRGQMRRLRRQFAAAGGTVRVCTQETAHADIAAFMRLHAGRWEGRGGSGIVAAGDRLSAMLEAVAQTHAGNGRLRLWMLEIENEPISAQLFIAAGGEVAYVNGGWDERFAHLKPAMLGILHAIEDAFARGEGRVDLGGGEQSYKLRFADGNDPVAWTIVMLPGSRLPLTQLRTMPMLISHSLRGAAKRTLTPEHADRLRSARQRLRSLCAR